MSIDVSFLVVAYNSANDLPDCIASLRAQQGDATWEALVLDNASTDHTDAVLRELAQEKHLRSDTNLGYAAGINQLYELARGRFIIPLNPDCRLAPRFLQLGLQAAYESAADVLAPLVLTHLPKSAEGSDADWLAIDSTVSRITREMRVRHLSGLQPSLLSGVKPPGPCAMYRRTFLDRMSSTYGSGLFDESFVTYGEDVDLACRGNAIGMSTYFAPQALAYHTRSASSGGEVRAWRKPPFTMSLLVAARYQNAVRHLTALHLPPIIALMLLEDCLVVGLAAVRRDGSLRKTIRGIAAAWHRVLRQLRRDIAFRRHHRTYRALATTWAPLQIRRTKRREVDLGTLRRLGAVGGTSEGG